MTKGPPARFSQLSDWAHSDFFISHCRPVIFLSIRLVLRCNGAECGAMKVKILVADDEPDALELIEVNLKGAGYDVVAAADGKQALQKARAAMPDLILLDIMLPEMDGLEICKALRKDAATAVIPIIMLTARAAEIDRVLGLELGADDYITKPFSPRELVLRVKNVLKRSRAEPVADDKIQFGGLVIDQSRHKVTYLGKPLELTATEFKLVTVLAGRKGRVQSRELLLKDVWGYNSLIDTRTIDTHMRRLRDKLGGAAKYLDTVRGVGYRFREE
jgi:DNA-binding response OmpR family regulator